MALRVSFIDMQLMSFACFFNKNFHQNIMIFFLGNMWMQIIKHFIWQLFTIADKGIPGPGNNQIAKASRGEAYMGGLQHPPQPLQIRVFQGQETPKQLKLPGAKHIWGAYSTLHNPQLQSGIFCYAKDAPESPKLIVTKACPQFLDYPQVKKWVEPKHFDVLHDKLSMDVALSYSCI